MHFKFSIASFFEAFFIYTLLVNCPNFRKLQFGFVRIYGFDMYKRIVVFIIVCIGFLPALAEEILDTHGREFYLTFMPNYHMGYKNSYLYDSLYIYISSDKAANGYIEYEGRNYVQKIKYFRIPEGGGEYKFAEWWREYEQEGFSEYGRHIPGRNGFKEKGVFHIVTDEDVSVYALNRAFKTTDGAMIFPVNTLGRKYMITSYYSNEKSKDTNIRNTLTPSQFSIVATENNTKINIKLTVPAYGEYSKQLTKILDRGDSYLIQADTSSAGDNYDLTGSTVISNKPIAVFSGHQRSLIPNNYQGILVSRDHLFSQITPIDVWGKTYIITPFPKAFQQSKVGNDLYRIVAANDDTEIYFNDVYITTLDKGEFYENDLLMPFAVRANRPISVAMFKKSSSGQVGWFNLGDPAFLLIPPNKQFLDEYNTYNLQAREFGLGSKYVYLQQFVTVIIPTLYASTLRLDSKLVDDNYFIEIPETCYSYAHLEVSDGSHNLRADKPFGVYVCGYGVADSYGYVGGMRFDTIPEVIPHISISPDTLICRGEIIELQAYDCISVVWSADSDTTLVSDFSITVTPDSTTTYTAVMVDSLGCEHEESVTVKVNQAEVNIFGTDELCYGEEGTLIAEGGVIYEWSENEFLDRTDTSHVKINPLWTTVFYVKCIDENGCEDSTSFKVEVHPQIFPDAGDDTGVCPGDSVELTASGGYTYQWDYDSTLSCYNCQTTSAKPKESQWYYVTVIDEFGCAERDSVFVDIYGLPDFEIQADTLICFASSTILMANSLSGAEYSYHWYPEELVEFPDSLETPIKPIFEDTEFYLIAETEFGCKDTISTVIHVEGCFLEVSDVVFEPEIYCFEETKETVILNTGGGKIRVDSLSLSGSDKGNFRYDLDNELPIMLTNENNIKVDVYFMPDMKEKYSAFINVYSQLDTIYRINITAEKLRGLAELGAEYLGGNEDIPGAYPEFMISIDSKHFDKIQPDYLKLKLSYDWDSFFVNDSSFESSKDIANWNMNLESTTLENQEKTWWDIELSGSNAISKKTNLFKFTPKTMLQSSNIYSFEIEGVIINREYCADLLTTEDSISVNFCADTIRAIIIYKDDYTVWTNGNIIEKDLEIKVTVPFKGNASLSLFDIQGREITVHSGVMKQGINEFIVPRDMLASQIYFLKFESGDSVIMRKILVR